MLINSSQKTATLVQTRNSEVYRTKTMKNDSYVKPLCHFLGFVSIVFVLAVKPNFDISIYFGVVLVDESPPFYLGRQYWHS